ncbi:DUF1045 domain-containing protein [Roseomonas sp. NAR14]|uniref:DUF1045 domain-containing protein n=1 Tax=Roseomonas acroporae TaxID=2937791 RepID=A0A9X1Y5X0_9PROT|nr:DUF1045 domain-containing protein [Roseomonas acroporae]MCK8783682.1 DUF1045 domain-containing protein [Roseomonas acroporae]
MNTAGTARVALYWAPELDDPLHHAASAWLGRDAETGAALEQPPLPDIHAITAEARLYGFHATLKAPFRPLAPWAEVREAAAAMAAGIAPFDLPPLAVAELGGFLALREAAPCPPLHALADTATEALDRFRAPPTEAELARRLAAGLGPSQEAMLRRWGYPHVFAEWRFHLTLTRRLTPAERDLYRPAAEAWVGLAAGRPRRVGSVCLFTQAAAGAPFRIAERLPLGGAGG